MRAPFPLPARLLALALTGALIGSVAGCGAPRAAPTTSSTPAPGTPSTSGAATSGPPGSGGTASAPVTPSSRRTAITVVAPPTPAAGGTAGPGDALVTTTVTVTPTGSRGGTAATGGAGTDIHGTAPVTARRSTPATAPATPPSSTAIGDGSLAGTVVVIDPGHNGANHLHPEIINKQVPAGFGEHKNCNTTGTETNDGYPEYRFNWKVALALRDLLQAEGITVVMTRDSDDGVGPCVNERAAIGNDAHADAVVSIHGDGESASIKGFYVMTASRPPAGQAMAGRSDRLAGDIRDGLAGAGFPVSNALGHDGLWTRSDLGGLNLSKRPTVMIECGNMRNAAEAELMSSADGQRRYADGIAAGVIAFLGG